MGTAISVNPEQLLSFAEAGNDRYVLIEVKSGKSFTYYAGAAWQGHNFFNKDDTWKDYF
ncbi:DUF4861 family protein [Pedobacter kyonggii]|uniref:DUF4861 family protein n=1 Tax=Pedobacter kyonggii TaxID=1926871 RepID=UPI0013EEF7EF|nr:DUF4861 family protein [Pedobacter kyonggii]